MTTERGWAVLHIDADVMQPGEVIHLVPAVAGSLAPQNGHELHPLCWCHPTRLSSLFDDALLLSHNDPSWPGARTDEQVLWS